MTRRAIGLAEAFNRRIQPWRFAPHLREGKTKTKQSCEDSRQAGVGQNLGNSMQESTPPPRLSLCMVQNWEMLNLVLFRSFEKQSVTHAIR